MVAEIDQAIDNHAFFHCIAEFRQPDLSGHRYFLIFLMNETGGILRYRLNTINFPLEKVLLKGIMFIHWNRGRNSVVECRLPKPKIPKNASICPIFIYNNLHCYIKNQLFSGHSVAPASGQQN